MLYKIKFVQEIPKLYTGKYINYYDYRLDEINAHFHSLQQIIKENQDEWLLDYDARHTQLYNLLLQKSKYYSFSGISRSTIWYPIDLDKLFFSLALLALLIFSLKYYIISYYVLFLFYVIVSFFLSSVLFLNFFLLFSVFFFRKLNQLQS